MTEITKTNKKLTSLEIEFVKSLLKTGGNLTKAIALTSYKGKNPSAQASVIWRKTRVQSAYKAALWDKIGRSAGAAINTLSDLNDSAASEHVKLAAAMSLLDRAGFKQQESLTVSGAVSVSFDLGNKSSSDTGATQHSEDVNEMIDITTQFEHVNDVDAT